MQGNSLRHYAGQGPQLPSQQVPLQKPKIVDASHIFKPPHRMGRPDHFVIILRGLPGKIDDLNSALFTFILSGPLFECNGTNNRP